jgi:hypothetical protein
MNERDNADCGIEADNLIELEALPDDDPRRVVSDSGLGRINFREDRLAPPIPRSMISSLSALAILDARPRRPNPFGSSHGRSLARSRPSRRILTRDWGTGNLADYRRQSAMSAYSTTSVGFNRTADARLWTLGDVAITVSWILRNCSSVPSPLIVI